MIITTASIKLWALSIVNFHWNDYYLNENSVLLIKGWNLNHSKKADWINKRDMKQPSVWWKLHNRRKADWRTNLNTRQPSVYSGDSRKEERHTGQPVSIRGSQVSGRNSRTEERQTG